MSWKQAAAGASFQAHLPVRPAPDHVHLGGFGFSGTITSHLAIRGVTAVGEIEVDTDSIERRAPASLHQRAQISAALTHYLHDLQASLVLPLELRVESEDRTISVDGLERVFRGLCVAGSDRWSGSCEVGDVRITVSITGSASLDAIESTDGHDLNDSPTPQR